MGTAKEMTFAQFREAMHLQLRVIKALIKREFIALYGRKGLGFFMMFVEPFVIMVFVITITTYHKSFQTSAFPMVDFVLSGWGVMWMCRYPIYRMSGVLQANSSFLYHRQITIFSIFTARAILGVMSAFVSFLFLFVIFIIVFNKREMYDPISVVVSFYMTAWHVLIMSIFSCILSSYTSLKDRASRIFGVSQVFMTGCFFMVDWIPERFRFYILLSPMVNVTELMRYGMFGDVVKCYFSIYYIAFSNIFLTYFVFQLLRKMVKTRDAYNTSN